jgi:general secretion pathway protein G
MHCNRFENGKSCRPSNKHWRTGFTLLEIMVVLVLIGMLAAMVTINVRNHLIKGKQMAAKAEIKTICSALESFYSFEGRYPTNEEGLSALTQKTDKIPEPLLNQNPIDPWGRPYQYNQPGHNNSPYDVESLGADGRSGGTGEDADIVSWDLKSSGTSANSTPTGSQ